jgi:hypothetical protein
VGFIGCVSLLAFCYSLLYVQCSTQCFNEILDLEIYSDF